MAAFDAPDREVCTVKRARTNTPLQALILMNDPTYVEASRILAEKILRLGGDTPSRLKYAFRLVTSRVATVRELEVLTAGLERQRERYAAHPQLATELLSIGETQRSDELDAAELAAWTMIASELLNLDETVTKR